MPRQRSRQRVNRPKADIASASSPNRAVGEAPRNPILELQRTVGNRAVGRTLESLRRARGPIRRESDIVDSRIDMAAVAEVPAKPVLRERKVTYKEAKSTAITSIGTAASNLTIEYSVDDTGRISVGALQPEYVITIFTPYISYSEFVPKFGPIMETLWDKHGGNMQSFSESAAVRGFNYEPQTRRHEEMHVNSRQLALRDKLPEYLSFLRDNKLLTSGVSKFIEKSHFYWKVAWDERVEEIIAHEQIYYLDAVQMVEEYRHRAPDEDPEETGGWAGFLKQFQ